MKQSVFYFIFILLIISSSYAHEGGEDISLDEELKENSVLYLYIASGISLIFIIYSLYMGKKPHFTNRKKLVAFLGIITPVILATIYLVGATIYLNAISETQGPVHWHADYEIYACGSKIEMKEPDGFSNKVGSEVFHHHGDNRIHVEGVLVDTTDADLHSFFEVTGGELTREQISIPTNSGTMTFKNGDGCNGDTGVLQAFLYKTTGTSVTQEKLTDFENYVLSPYPNIPPGDCIIIEFDKEKSETKHICETYRIAIEKGAQRGS